MTIGSKKRVKKEEYIKFADFCDSVGIWNLNIMAYSEQTGIPKSTVGDWKQEYLKHWKFNKKDFAKQLNQQGLTTLKRIALLGQGKDKNTSLKAAKTFMDASDKYVDILVKLGIIEPEIEEVSVQINASDKDLYKMLNKTQRKKLAKIAEDA